MESHADLMRSEEDTSVLDVGRARESLSTPRPNTVEFIRRLKEDGQPVVLSVNGKVDLVVQDAKSLQQLLELVDRLETLEGIRAGLEDMKAGRTKSFEEAKQEVRRKHGIPL